MFYPIQALELSAIGPKQQLLDVRPLRNYQLCWHGFGYRCCPHPMYLKNVLKLLKLEIWMILQLRLSGGRLVWRRGQARVFLIDFYKSSFNYLLLLVIHVKRTTPFLFGQTNAVHA